MNDFRITEMDRYLFGAGTHYEIYNKMGAHLACENGTDGVYFAVWAPNARSVSVVGDFNAWLPGRNPMLCVDHSGIYDIFIPGLKKGDLYKFAIETKWGDILFKADPYGNQSQMRLKPPRWLQICPTGNGPMNSGRKTENLWIPTAAPCLYMRFIWVPGKRMRPEITVVSELTERWPQNWQIMLPIWGIRMLN